MPVPIYFRFDDREANVTQDEAGEIANALSRASYLHNQILTRLDGALSTPIAMDAAPDEDLAALQRVLTSLAAARDLSPAVRVLERRTAEEIQRREKPPLRTV